MNIVESYSFSAPAIKELEVRRDGLFLAPPEQLAEKPALILEAPMAAAPVDAAPPIDQGRVSAFCRIGVETKRADAPRLSERLDGPGAGFGGAGIELESSAKQSACMEASNCLPLAFMRRASSGSRRRASEAGMSHTPPLLLERDGAAGEGDGDRGPGG